MSSIFTGTDIFDGHKEWYEKKRKEVLEPYNNRKPLPQLKFPKTKRINGMLVICEPDD